MPLYSYRCEKCQNVFDEFRRYEDRDIAPSHCDGWAVKRIFTPPMIASEERAYPEYESPASGKMIRGRREHLEDLARTGCRIKEPGETAAYMKKVASGELKREREESLAKAVNEAVCETARDMGLSVG